MQVTIGGLNEYTTVCCVCGCALKTQEVAARLSGEYIDYIHRSPPMDATLVFCPDCKIKIELYANDSVQKAWFRMQELERGGI